MPFDLCVHAKWFPVLDQGIEEVIHAPGEFGGEPSHKHWLSRLDKMDSFIVEDQRVNPPVLRE